MRIVLEMVSTYEQLRVVITNDEKRRVKQSKMDINKLGYWIHFKNAPEES